MKILGLSRLQPDATTELIQANLKAEAHRAWELYKGGTFREMYIRQDRPGGVIVIECASLEQARELVNSLPLVKAGCTEFELIPLGYFRTLEAIFAPSD